jgi:hypothetical protein
MIIRSSSTDCDRNIGFSHTIDPDNAPCNLPQTAPVLRCHHGDSFFLPPDFAKQELESQEGSFSAIHEERKIGFDKSKFIRIWEVR